MHENRHVARSEAGGQRQPLLDLVGRSPQSLYEVTVVRRWGDDHEADHTGSTRTRQGDPGDLPVLPGPDACPVYSDVPTSGHGWAESQEALERQNPASSWTSQS